MLLDLLLILLRATDTLQSLVCTAHMGSGLGGGQRGKMYALAGEQAFHPLPTALLSSGKPCSLLGMRAHRGLGVEKVLEPKRAGEAVCW